MLNETTKLDPEFFILHLKLGVIILERAIYDYVLGPSKLA